MNTTLSKWNPFNELSDLQSRLSSILSGSGVAEPGAEGHTSLMNADWQPAVDISEDDKEYLVTADLPEVKKDEVHIGVENGVLTITGERTAREMYGARGWVVRAAAGFSSLGFVLSEGR